MYSIEQQIRIKSIIRHIWCNSLELLPDCSNLGYIEKDFIIRTTKRELLEEIDQIFGEDQSEKFPLYKALKTLNLLEQYELDGRPTFASFSEWFHFKTN